MYDDGVLHPHHVLSEGILYFITCHESICMMMGFFTPIMSCLKVFFILLPAMSPSV